MKRDRQAGRERAAAVTGPHPAAGIAEGRDTDGVWRRAREVLSDHAFTALWLRYVEGLQARQIARVLGKNRVAVSMMLCRAREALAGHLSDAGPAPTAAALRPLATEPKPAGAPPALAQGVTP